MDCEFHYHVTYLLAILAQFEPSTAYKIAYSSQYLDDNTRIFTVWPREKGLPYQNLPSQCYNPLVDEHLIANIYPIFHFIPGLARSSAVQRLDGQAVNCVTTANAPLARQ